MLELRPCTLHCALQCCIVCAPRHGTQGEPLQRPGRLWHSAVTEGQTYSVAPRAMAGFITASLRRATVLCAELLTLDASSEWRQDNPIPCVRQSSRSSTCGARSAGGADFAVLARMPRLAALALPAGAAGGAIHACHSFGMLRSIRSSADSPMISPAHSRTAAQPMRGRADGATDEGLGA
jgi:hypothetical protein